MQTLTKEGRATVEMLASRHNVSFEAARAVLFALVAGGGTQAQFNHPDLGGMGQWSQGGMVMIGDMFNHGLKARVDALCADLAEALRQGLSLAMRQPPSGPSSSLFVPAAPSSRWPEDLGSPASSGSQNDLHYAFFPQSRRLALDHGGRITVYDTGDHRITGFAQAQGGGQSISFTSQHGLIDLAALHQISPEKAEAAKAPPSPSPTAPHLSDEEIFSRIERLAALHEKKIITDEEFNAKKADLLSRL
jgi:hypothetical protein